MGACCVVVWQASLSLASHFWALFGLLVRGVENAVPSREGMEVVGPWPLGTWFDIQHTPGHLPRLLILSESPLLLVASSSCYL